jgi:hypothetical protein
LSWLAAPGSTRGGMRRQPMWMGVIGVRPRGQSWRFGLQRRRRRPPAESAPARWRGLAAPGGNAWVSAPGSGTIKRQLTTQFDRRESRIRTFAANSETEPSNIQCTSAQPLCEETITGVADRTKEIFLEVSARPTGDIPMSAYVANPAFRARPYTRRIPCLARGGIRGIGGVASGCIRSSVSAIYKRAENQVCCVYSRTRAPGCPGRRVQRSGGETVAPPGRSGAVAGGRRSKKSAPPGRGGELRGGRSGR